jgi:hypothetical protein
LGFTPLVLTFLFHYGEGGQKELVDSKIEIE